MKTKRIPQDLQIWIDARKKYRLGHDHIQMARELGMNPKKLGKLANHRTEPSKLPLPQFVEQIYFKHFGKTRPDRVLSIEQRAMEIEQKNRAQERTQRSLETKEHFYLTLRGMDRDTLVWR